MQMEDFVEMLKAIAEDMSTLVPHQFQEHGEINKIISAIGSPVKAYEYFKMVLEAANPKMDEVRKRIFARDLLNKSLDSIQWAALAALYEKPYPRTQRDKLVLMEEVGV